MNNEPVSKEGGEAIDDLFQSMIVNDRLLQTLFRAADDKLGELGIFDEDVYPYAITAAVKLAAECSANSMGFLSESPEKNAITEHIANEMFSVIEKSMANMKLDGGKQDE